MIYLDLNVPLCYKLFVSNILQLWTAVFHKLNKNFGIGL